LVGSSIFVCAISRFKEIAIKTQAPQQQQVLQKMWNISECLIGQLQVPAVSRRLPLVITLGENTTNFYLLTSIKPTCIYGPFMASDRIVVAKRGKRFVPEIARHDYYFVCADGSRLHCKYVISDSAISYFTHLEPVGCSGDDLTLEADVDHMNFPLPITVMCPTYTNANISQRCTIVFPRFIAPHVQLPSIALEQGDIAITNLCAGVKGTIEHCLMQHLQFGKQLPVSEALEVRNTAHHLSPFFHVNASFDGFSLPEVWMSYQTWVGAVKRHHGFNCLAKHLVPTDSDVPTTPLHTSAAKRKRLTAPVDLRSMEQ